MSRTAALESLLDERYGPPAWPPVPPRFIDPRLVIQQMLRAIATGLDLIDSDDDEVPGG